MPARRFTTPMIRLGSAGLVLKASRDARDPLAATRLQNLVDTYDGELRVRDGLTSLATATGVHHSVARFNDPSASTFTRVWGVGSSLFRGASGALTSVEAGYSGSPLTFVPTRMPLTDEDWIFIADSAKVRKLRFDGTILPIGIAAPGSAVSPSVNSLATTGICAFDTSDTSEAATWTRTAGVDAAGNASGTPTAANVTGLSGNAVAFSTVVNLATSGYSSLAGKSLTKDLSLVSGIPASDDDFLHLWIKCDRPDYLQEVRVYLVVDNTFSASTIPGTSASSNQDAYMKAFRGSDLTGFVQQRVSAVRAQETVQWASAFPGPDDVDPFAPNNVIVEMTDADRTASEELAAGVDVWTEYGVVGLPLRRGDFVRLGTDTTRTWATVTGVILLFQTSAAQAITVTFDDCFLGGGYGPDAAVPGATSYDWRSTHYDPRTGEESNPSPVMAAANYASPRRQRVTLTPAAHSDSAMRQRFYRRGGLLGENWFFSGVNTSNGGTYIDELTDAAIETAGTLALDNDQPVSTVDSAGATVLAQPLPILFGPVQGITFGLGDPHRPGVLYWSKVDAPHAWPSANLFEVTPSSEPLQTGVVWGNQAFCLSHSRLYAIYPHLSGSGQVEVTPTPTRLGVAGRWAVAVSPRHGILLVSANQPGVYATTGGEATRLSDDIQPLFEGETVNGIPPVDWAAAAEIRLTVHRERLYLTYKSTSATYLTLVCSLWKRQLAWRLFSYAGSPAHATVEDGVADPTLIIGSRTANASYSTDPAATTDGGTGIAFQVRTGSLDYGESRTRKVLGDLVIDANRAGETLTVTTLLDDETTTNASIAISAGSGRQQTIQDPFGTEPQEAQSVAVDITGTASVGKPILYQAGVSALVQPDRVIQRATDWDDLGVAGEKIVTGVILDCQTYNATKTVLVEGLRGSVGPTTLGTLTVVADGRQRLTFSGMTGVADLLRLRPTDTNPWEVFSVEWIAQPGPPRVVTWDSFDQTLWDTYYTGLDLECDTGGLAKTVRVTIDGTVVVAAASVTASGRRVVHITLPAGRGHVYRFASTDANPGILYSWRWHVASEPSEQANWNQKLTLAGDIGDKQIKGVILECDTGNVAKTVTVEINGSVSQTLTVTANGRSVHNFSWAQVRGRTLRLASTDTVPARLYQVQWIYDDDAYALPWWESQETDHGVGGWFIPVEAWVTLRAPLATAHFTLTVFLIQPDGTLTRDVYDFTAVASQSVKSVVRVPFLARKAVMARYVLHPNDRSITPVTTQFWLYREETHVLIQPWAGGEAIRAYPFGTDGLGERPYSKRHQGGSRAEDARVGTVEGRPVATLPAGSAPPPF